MVFCFRKKEGASENEVREVIYETLRSVLEWNENVEYLFRCIFANDEFYTYCLSTHSNNFKKFHKETRIREAALKLELDPNMINLLLKQKFRYKGASQELISSMNEDLNYIISQESEDKQIYYDVEIDYEFITNFHDLLYSSDLENQVLEYATHIFDLPNSTAQFIINLIKIKNCYSEQLSNELYESELFKQTAQLIQLSRDELMGIICIIIGEDGDPRVHSFLKLVFARFNLKHEKEKSFARFKVI